MYRKLAGMATIALWVAASWAQVITQEEISGTWEFQAYAEVDDPEELTPVGVIMEFRADGTVIHRIAPGVEAQAAFALDGNTITYSDEQGDQVWTIRSFEEGTLVIEHQGILMFLRRFP